MRDHDSTLLVRPRADRRALRLTPAMGRGARISGTLGEPSAGGNTQGFFPPQKRTGQRLHPRGRRCSHPCRHLGRLLDVTGSALMRVATNRMAATARDASSSTGSISSVRCWSGCARWVRTRKARRGTTPSTRWRPDSRETRSRLAARRQKVRIPLRHGQGQTWFSENAAGEMRLIASPAACTPLDDILPTRDRRRSDGMPCANRSVPAAPSADARMPQPEGIADDTDRGQ